MGCHRGSPLIVLLVVLASSPARAYYYYDDDFDANSTSPANRTSADDFDANGTCADDSDFVDANGFDCEDHEYWNCEDYAINHPELYDAAAAREVLRRCPRACGACFGTCVSRENRTAATYAELRAALTSRCVDVTIVANISVEDDAMPDGSGLVAVGSVVLRGAPGAAISLSGDGTYRILYAEDADVTLRDLILEDGLGMDVKPERSGSSRYTGGAVYTSASVLRIWGCAFLRNRAYSERVWAYGYYMFFNTHGYGGAIYQNDYSILAIGDARFELNVAEFEGGAIYATTTHYLTLRPGVVFANNSASEGGAILHEGWGTLSSGSPADARYRLGARFVGNEATDPDHGNAGDLRGGAIKSSACAVDLYKVDARDNTANAEGGFLYYRPYWWCFSPGAARVALSDVVVDGSTAGEMGGAFDLVINDEYFAGTPTATASDVVVRGAKAPKGGAFAASHMNLVFANVTIEGATADDGAAFYMESADVGIDDVGLRVEHDRQEQL